MASAGPPTGGTGGWQDVQKEFRLPLVALALTTVVAGLVDAFTLLRYGVFTANQSGNIVHVGMGLSGRFPQWPAALASIVAFGAGGALAARLRRSHRDSPPARELVGVIVAVTLWSVADVLLESGQGDRGRQAGLAALAAVSLGILALLFARTAGVMTTTTYQTSTVLSAAQGLSDWIGRGDRSRRASRRWRLGLIGICGYALGGAIGALIQRSPAWVFGLAIGILATLLATAHEKVRSGG